MPFFSVIIPTYNRYESLKKAIDFLLIHQTFRDFELIVVDDGSTDETHQIEDEYRDQLVYIKQKNYGVSKARNVGIANSNSPYISFHDSDDLWYPRKLENQYMYILNNPDFLINILI